MAEVYLFDRRHGVQPPPPAALSQVGSAEHPEWVRRALSTRDFNHAAVQEFTLALRVFDENLRPIAGAGVRFEDPATERVADGNRIVETSFRAGQGRQRVEWWHPETPEHVYTSFYYVEFEGDDDGVMRKLHNLGFMGQDAIDSFQERFERPVPGTLDDVREDVERWHDHGSPPEPGSKVTFVSHEAAPGGPGGPRPSGPTRAAPPLHQARFTRWSLASSLEGNLRSAMTS